MPRRPTARLAKAQQRFKTALTDYIISKGAQPSQFYQYEIDTPAGKLGISVYDDWIACRFDDVDLGRQFSATCGKSCNPYSGKWNFHFFNGYVASLNPDSVIELVGFYLDRLMAWSPQCQTTGV